MRSAPHRRPSTDLRPRASARRLAGAFLLLCAACRPSPETQAAHSVASIRSWTATARLAGEAWLQGKTPAAYTRSTLEKAGTTLSREARTLRRARRLPARVAGDLALLRMPAGHARRMAAGVARGDRAAVVSGLAALASLDARLAALDDRLRAEAGRP